MDLFHNTDVKERRCYQTKSDQEVITELLQKARVAGVLIFRQTSHRGALAVQCSRRSDWFQRGSQ
jgi:hypothetical protein